MSEDEMVGQCHQSYQHEFDPTPGGSGRQDGLACSIPWGSPRVRHDLTTKEEQRKVSLGERATSQRHTFP